MKSRPVWKLATVTALLIFAIGPSTLGAQQVDEPASVLSAGEVGEDMDLSHLQSPFNLYGAGDLGVVGTRSNGQSANCISNVGHAGYFSNGCASPQYTRNSGGGVTSMYFDLRMGWLAPPSNLPDVVDPDASGLIGGGWTHNVPSSVISVQGGSDKVGPSDRGAELLAFGVETTNDGDCTDFTGASNAFIRTGFQVLPVANCPQTHPGGEFGGRRLAEQEVYLDLFETDPTFSDGDPFAFWRVPEELQKTEPIGDFHTYGEFNDYYFEALPRYGAIVPGQEGDPEYAGWPLGLDVFFDAFYWGLPTVGGTTYWMATIVNNSEQVYGVPVDYDSVYYAIYYNPLIIQQSSQYLDTKRSAILHNSLGDGCTLASDLTPTSFCPNRSGFGNGAAGIVVLKSPIGDLRYKKFSDPESDFFSPGHPLAGDTITIQHRHNCGFGGCYPNTLARSQRAAFGLYSSTGQNVLDGLAPSEYGGGDAGAYWLTFRDEDFPTLTGEFNKYVPGVDDDNPIWDYNHDGVPDTIYADDCGPRGCVGVWSDTLPGGHINYYGNISAASIGPFDLAAGDTAGILIGFVGAADSAGIESSVNNTIEFYQNFFLGPEAAPAPTIVAVDTETGSVDSAAVTLFWDNATEDFVDPFLSTLDVSADAELNPWLVDSLATLAENNVAALHLFRSCDGGNSYSSDNDCDGDPVDAEDAKFGGFGWEPYRTFEPDDGELPNTFTDNAITAGIEYTYVLVSETVGAVLNVVRGEEGNLQAETVTFAPKLLSPLSSARSNPNVAVAYVPVNLAGGAERAQIEELGRTGVADVPINISLVGSAPEGGTFRTVFVDSVVVEQTETITDGEVTSVSTTVRGLQIRTDTEGEIRVINEFTFTREGDLAMSGLSTEGTEETATERVTTFAGGQAMILVNEDGNTPLLASTTLTGSAATPGGFIGRDDFPFFSLGVDAGSGGTFAGDFYVSEQGDTLLGRVEPSVGRLASGTSPLDASQFGTYELEFSGEPFGPLAPFAISQPETAGANFEASMQQRPAASQTTTDPAAIEAVNEAAGLNLSAEDAVAYNLPFTVRNISYSRSVQVVMAQHQETVTIGQGLEAIEVDVPGNNWVPGDQLYFVEQIEREVTDEDGQTVFGGDGRPVTETVTAATFSVMLGCTEPRDSCDPTFGGSRPSGYNTLDPGTDYFVRYLVPFTGGEEFRFRLDPAVQLAEVEAVSDSALANVHVVPNPYVFASYYERATADRVLKFTNLPPEGTLRIYDVAGRFVQEIAYTQDDLQGQGSQGGDLNWDLTTREGLELSYGLYIFVLESDFGSTMGKFVVIR